MSDGGPAFPVQSQLEPRPEGGFVNRAEYESHQTGMTLLDYFAGQALMGMLANDACMQELLRRGDEGVLFKRCYRLAAAMLAERERLNKEQMK